MYKFLLKPWLFRQDAEDAHNRTFRLIRRAMRLPAGRAFVRQQYGHETPALAREVFGLRFPNPVGLAAGMDKNAELIHYWKAFGLGFVEIGTVTPRPQEGNPQPRLFRLPKDRALINRMGFNNDGALKISRRLEKRPRDLILGANIGKNKTTPNTKAVEDYVLCFQALAPYCDYFVVNVSSPNTPGLRELQSRHALRQILDRLQELNQGLPAPRPLLLKIAPDLTVGQLDDVIDIARLTHLSGLIATNTTVSRDNLQTPTPQLDQIGNGGLSGAPLRSRATEIIRYIVAAGLPVIGVGGIDSPAAAREKLDAGAALVQLYTGLVYEGPGLVKRIKKDLKTVLEAK